MNQTATMQKLDEMRLHGFSRVYREMMETNKNNEFSTDEIISHLVQAEWDEPENCQGKLNFNCVQLRVSGWKNHYKAFLSAGVKAKSVTNNLPIFSMLAAEYL